MTRTTQTSGSQRRKRILWSNALLAVAPVALFIAAPAPVHAGGECTALANVNNGAGYNACRTKMGVRCANSGGFVTEYHHTCTYPDGGRDECIEHTLPPMLSLGVQTVDFSCTYVPPGPEPAPAPEPGAEPR